MIFVKKKKYLSAITKEIVLEAIGLIKPIIEDFGSKIWIVVTDPNKQFDDFDFYDSILLEYEVGTATEKRKQNATGKAKFSWENGLPSKMASVYPRLLAGEDCVWGGSWVVELKPGIYFVVAVSGFTEAKDELISQFIINTIEMLIAEKVVALKDSDEAAIIR